MNDDVNDYTPGAALFSRWLLVRFGTTQQGSDEAFACLAGFVMESQEYFKNKKKLDDDYLSKILSSEYSNEGEKLIKLEKSVRKFLKFCLYKQAGIPKGEQIAYQSQKDKIKRQIKDLDLDKTVSMLVQVLKELCEEFSEIIEEGQDMPNENERVASRFDYDVSCLPKDFEKEEYRNNYKETVTNVLKKLRGKDEQLPDEIVSAVIGLLLLDGQFDFGTENDEGILVVSNNFYNQVLEVYGDLSKLTAYEEKDGELSWSELQVFEDIYDRLKKLLPKDNEKIFYQDYAAAGREVIRGIGQRPPSSDNYDTYVLSTYRNKNFSCGLESSPHGGGNGIVSIELPPLSGDGSGSDEIVPDNIKAVATIYMAYQLEQLQLIPATDRVVELSMAGLLPYTYDSSMRIIDEYAWSQTDRLNDVARYSQYSRALGVTGGQVTQDVVPNTQFSERLRHAVSSIANFANTYDTQKPLNDRSEYVRKSIRDLAANASYYGWAGTFFVAERLRKHINDAIAILSLPQIQDAYGVTNMWQVIERVAQREFGITVNVVKHRTLASETKYIFDKIANKAPLWSNPTSGRRLFTISQMIGNQLVEERGDLDKDETDKMFRAAQYILAVEGYGDTQVDQYSQPVATTATPSLPSLGAIGGGGSIPSVDTSKIDEMRNMVSKGQMPNINQILS